MSWKSKIKAVVFDVDGVVINSIDSKGKYFWSRTIKQDLGITGDHFKSIFSKQWDDVTRGKLSTEDHFEEVFAKFDDIEIDVDQFIAYWLSHDNFLNQELISMIKYVNVPVYLATNQDSYRTAHIKKLVGNHFLDIFSSCNIGHLKTEKEFFYYVQNLLNLTPEQILLIDDTRDNLDTAYKCGWQIYHYQGQIEKLKQFFTGLYT